MLIKYLSKLLILYVHILIQVNYYIHEFMQYYCEI